MRKLASIQVINEITPIEGADKIELLHVLGWKCVAKKGEFKPGDKCIYFEVDSFLPVIPEFEFLRASSYKKNDIMGEGFKIKTAKLRGEFSQGLCLPLSTFKISDSTEVDTDVSEVLGVKKWDMPEQATGMGVAIGPKPFCIPTTDETRVQSIDALRQALLGKPYYITTKMDGTSCTVYKIKDQIGVCSRNNELKDTDDCAMWRYMHEHGVIDALKGYDGDLVLQGEFCGEGIQKNRLKLKKPAWYIFNILDPETMRLYDWNKIKDICAQLGLTTVPEEEVGDNFNYTLDELLERAQGLYPSGQQKEGIVIRPLTPEFCKELGKDLSFKVLNNKFLLKED